MLPAIALLLFQAAFHLTVANYEVHSALWQLHGGAGTGPYTTATEWATAFSAVYRDEVDFTITQSGGSAAQAGLVGEVDCVKRYKGHPTLCSTPPKDNYTNWGAGGLSFPSSWYDTYAELDIQLLPMLGGPICVIYSKDVTGNLGSSEDRGLNMSMELVGSLLGGRITYWDDPQVQALNPGLSLPHERVSVVVRSDKSSLNDAITKSLARSSPWWTQVPGFMEKAVGKAPKWPLSNYSDPADDYYKTQDFQEGLVVSVLRRPFSMSYVDLTQVRKFTEVVGAARIISNFTGLPVPPTPDTVSNAMDACADQIQQDGSTLALNCLDPQKDASYPITRFVYWYIKKAAAANGDCHRTWLLKEFILFSYLPSAKAIADRNGWVIPPPSIVQLVRSKLQGMMCIDAETRQPMSVTNYMPPQRRLCPSGQYIKEAARANAYVGCRDCPVGTHQPLDRQEIIFACALCKPGTFAAFEGQPECNQCSAGTFQPNPGQSICKACPAGKYSPTEQSTSCFDCPEGSSTDGAANATTCKPCEIGMYADKMGLKRCLPCPEPFLTKAQGSTSKSLCGCPPGTFLGADNTCEECTLGLFCPGFGRALEAAPGYMLLGPDDSRRLAEGSDDAPVGRLAGPPPDVYRCLPAEVCPGGPPGVCTGGRVGRGCSGCPDGQAMDGGECEPCENAGGGWMLALWWFLVIGCSLCLFIVGSIYSHSRASASELALSGAASSLVMILQVLGLISLLTIPWPTALRTFVHNLEIFLFDASAHFGFECVASSPMQKFAVNASTLPVALITIGMSFVFGRFFFVAGEVAAIKNVAGMLLYLGFLPLITSALVPMMCYKHPAGTRSLIKFPAILCGSDIHHAMLAIAVPLLACALAFLAYLIALAWWAPAKSACSDESARAAFLRSTKFIFERCRPDQWFWGCFVLPRSLLMSMVPVLAPDDSRVQVVLFASLLAVYMVLQVRIWPWRVPVMNVLDLVVAMLLVLAIVTAGVAFVPLASTSSSSSGFASLLILFLMAPLFLTGFVFLGAGIVTFHRRFMARGAEEGTVAGCAGRRSSWISASSVFPQTLQSQGLAEELAAQSAALQDMSAEEVRSLVWSLEVYDSYAVAAALSALAAAGLNPKHRRQSWHSEGSQTRKGRLPSRILLHTPFTGKDTLDVKEDRRPEDRGAGGRGPHGDVQHPFGVPCGDAEEMSLDALPGGPFEDSSRDGAREVSADLTGIVPTTSTPSIVPAGLFAKGAQLKEENTDLI